MTGHGRAGPLTLADYAELARARLGPAVWDFVEGGAGAERTLAANLAAFEHVRLRPRVLTGLGLPHTKTEVLGRVWEAPIGVAPMAYHTLADPEGEVATARAGAPLVVSTFAGRTFEDIAAAAAAPLWLQVYCFRDRTTTRRLVERAEAAGFEALVLTADAPRLGRRVRDLRNGFLLPSGVAPANLTGTGFSSPGGHAAAEFDAALDWSVVAWLRSISSLPVLVKGVLTASDAVLAREAGAGGVVVSNHGGRQLDGVPATFDVLPEIAAALRGSCAVLLDGGVRRGADVLACLALGADAVLLGRPVLHGLAVGGSDGVAGVLGIVTDELAEAMLLTGVPAPRDAGPALLTAASPAAAASELPAAVTTTAPAPSEPVAGGVTLRRHDLHGSLNDPLLDTMNFLNEITHRYPDALSFAPGRPHDGFFDTEDVFTHLRRYVEHLEQGGATPAEVRSALYQYGPTNGQIRELVAASLRADEGIDVPPASIVVTVGAQEAMLLALRALIRGPEDVLLVSSPCYVGITGAARLLDVATAVVEEGAEGLRCADVEAVILAERARGRRPRAFYVVPDHSNPSGATMPLGTREELLRVCARHDVLLLEDSPYRMVSPGPQLPTLKALDRERRVVQLGSFSKTLFPGARVGYAVADQPVEGGGLLADELSKIKSMVTVNTSAVSQAVVAGMLLAARGRTSELNTGPAAHYGEAMRVTLRELAACFPDAEQLGVSWNEPTGGFFLTLRVPFAAGNEALVRSAEEFGVIWTPMSYFYPQGGGDHAIRLSVSYLPASLIPEGCARLSRFVRAQTG